MPGSNKHSEESAPTENSSTPFVSVENVSKYFGTVTALSQVSLRIEKGTIFGLVGSDGAGKTTLLRMIATMIKPAAGRILVDGLDVVAEKSRVKGLIGYMPQRFGLYHDLTVEENLDFFMDIFGVFGTEREKRKEEYLRFSNLFPFVRRLAGDLSGGMKQKLGLACVLVHQPLLLILDEPTNGVDPVSRQEFWDILGRMRAEGMTILVATAYLDEGEKCDRLAMMHRAQVLDEASPREIQSHFSDLEEAMVCRIKQVDEALEDDRFTS
jgi:ABC-2 type transport system ATP-binding protein